MRSNKEIDKLLGHEFIMGFIKALRIRWLRLIEIMSTERMPIAHGKIFCQIYFIKRFMKQNFIIKCTLLMEKFYKILSFIKYFTK